MQLQRLIRLATLFFGIFAFGQVSPDCSAAVPICSNTPINGGADGFGMDDFNGQNTSGCLERTTTGSIESNSAWYRFRTNASGQLGFNIGHDSNEDWDFALYLATDCTDLGEPIRCNFFDNSDNNAFIGVGEDPTGNANNVQYEDYITVAPGEDYYLFINNFSTVNSGFSIQFSGEVFVDNPNSALDCSIISNLLGSPIIACSNIPVVLDATTNNALSYSWYLDTGFGFLQFVGETSNTLNADQDGVYRVEVITPMGAIISDVQVAFAEVPITFPVEDESFCQSNLGFDFQRKTDEVLGGQLPSNYLVSYFISQQDADQNINALTGDHIPPIGDQTIYIRVSAIENPDCYDASQSFVLSTIAPPELGADEEIRLCEGESGVSIGETVTDPNYSYEWNNGETTPMITVSESGSYVLTATTTVNNVFCIRTRTITVVNGDAPRISGIAMDGFSYQNTIRIETEVDGNFSYRLDDGPYQEQPIFDGVLPGSHTVYMRDNNGCGEDVQDIAVVGYVPFFTPNGDGANEDWHLLGLEFFDEPLISIFDRYGKIIVQLTANSPGWDGTRNGQQLPMADYWFKLTYLNENGSRVEAEFLQSNFSLRR